MGMVEAQRVMSYVFGLLQADNGPGGVATLVGGRIYQDRVPATAPLPAATITLVSATDSSTLGGNRVLQTVLIDVALHADGASYGPLSAAADRVDTVLQNVGAVVNGVNTVELQRTQVTRFIDDQAGKSYAHLIQTYTTPSHRYP